MTPPDADPRTPSERVDLPIDGMTCASCVGRIEKGLGRARRRRRVPGQPGHRDRDRPLRRRGRPAPTTFAAKVADSATRCPSPTGARATTTMHDHADELRPSARG